tara:strand:+ start:347 stop:1174 length:828 start_codon:yes stop_codon:yes gene_type:complete
MDFNKNLINNISKEWNLKIEEKSFKTKTGFIQFVNYQGVPAILKISSSKDENTAEMLKYYNGYGAVKLLRSRDNISLISRAIPATPLKELVLNDEDDKACKVFCEIVKKIHSDNNYKTDSYPEIIDWASGFDEYIKSGNNQIPLNLINEAKNIFLDLVKSQTSTIVLHGDLHHKNILLDQEEGWLAIDPKGIVGEKEIEVSAFLKNPIGHIEIYGNPQIIKGRLDIIAEGLQLDRERILLWCYCLTILSSIWLLEVKENPRDWLRLAKIIKQMIK